MRKRAEWRALLDTIIQVRGERERIAAQIGVAAVTLTRWASGESSPRPQNLRLLVQAIPEQYRAAFQAQIEEDLPDLSLEEPTQEVSRQEIPFSFISTVLATRATGAPHYVSWVMIHQILQNALLQLDSRHLGMKITIAQCMPPRSDGTINSLREGLGLGTPPWPERLEQQPLFLGAETLVGYATATAHSHQVSDLRAVPSLLPYYRAEYEVSAAACPIMWHGRIAGCVLFSSTQVGMFDSEDLSILLQGYTNLMALAFDEQDFYATDRIQLRVMPPPEVQQRYFANFQQRVVALMRESASTGHSLSSTQAEQKAWQQIEALLLDLPFQTP